MDHLAVTATSHPTTDKKKSGANGLAIAAATDVGKTRTVNEDFFYFSDALQLAIVCDGMGGLQGGATASRMAGKTFRDAFGISDLAMLARLCDDVKEKLPSPLLKMAIGARLANRRVYLSGLDDRTLKGMGTTIAALTISENMVYLAHIGDSRIYLIRDSMLMQLTQDHSWINELLEDHDIKQDEVEQFRKKNVLTRALGTHPATKIDLQALPLQANDSFLLCSDGLFNALSEEQMLTILLEHGANLQTAADALVQSAKNADGSDNITAVLVTVNGKPAAEPKQKPLSMVLPEEEPRQFVLEDRFLRDRYALQTPANVGVSDRRKFFWSGTVGGLALLVILIFYAIWQKPATTNLPPDDVEPAVEARRAEESPVRNDAPQPLTGNFALVQFSSNAKLKELAVLPGVKVLDSFSIARNGQAAYGRYSFVLVDSMERVVYRQNKIAIGRSVTAAKSSASSVKKAAAVTENLKTGGQVYLVGLDGTVSGDAMVLANEEKIASVRQVMNSGFFLKPGVYRLSIKDTAGRVVLQKANVEIRKGEVKAVELAR
jgi:protein phosphatase